MEKRLRQVLNSSAIKILGLLLVFACFGCKSQSKYKVESVYLVPDSDYTLIRVVDLEDKNNVAVLSEWTAQESGYTDSLTVGKVFSLQLSPVEFNPIKEVLPANTRGSQVLFIDGVKVYDPKESLFFSSCLNGKYLKSNCK